MPKRRIEKRKRTPKEILRSNGVVVKHSTSKNTWKQFERDVAALFGTKRVPLSGSNSGHGTNSDTLHERLYIECKVRQKISLWALFEDTEKKAKAEKKTPVVAIKQKGSKGMLIVMRPKDIEKILKEIHNENGNKNDSD